MICIAHAQVAAEKREIFVAAAKTCIAASREEPGCLAYDMSESVTMPNHFTFVERYSDRTAVDSHMKSPHLAAFLAAAGPCLAGPPSLEAIEPKVIDKLM